MIEREEEGIGHCRCIYNVYPDFSEPGSTSNTYPNHHQPSASSTVWDHFPFAMTPLLALLVLIS